MSMDSNGKGNRLLRSFGYAFSGIFSAVRAEKNLQIHLSISILVIAAGVFLSISWIEWAFVVLAIGGMISLELINSAVERVVDLVTKEHHPLAKQAKDMAAGAVLVYAIASVILGVIIFLPKIIMFLK